VLYLLEEELYCAPEREVGEGDDMEAREGLSIALVVLDGAHIAPPKAMNTRPLGRRITP
jgi:hypothetical protein